MRCGIAAYGCRPYDSGIIAEVSTTAAATSWNWSRAAGLVSQFSNDLVIEPLPWDTLVYSQNRVATPCLNLVLCNAAHVGRIFTADRNHEFGRTSSIKALE